MKPNACRSRLIADVDWLRRSIVPGAAKVVIALPCSKVLARTPLVGESTAGDPLPPQRAARWTWQHYAVDDDWSVWVVRSLPPLRFSARTHPVPHHASATLRRRVQRESTGPRDTGASPHVAKVRASGARSACGAARAQVYRAPQRSSHRSLEGCDSITASRGSRRERRPRHRMRVRPCSRRDDILPPCRKRGRDDSAVGL